MSELKQIAPGHYLLPKEGEMKVPGLIIASEGIFAEVEIERPLEQVRNVAHLPGIVGYSIAMPDVHWGYGFPIGGVAGTDSVDGVISPGGVGYDINCGVRLAFAPKDCGALDPKYRERLLKKLFDLVPSGVGHGHKKTHGLSDQDYANIAEKGSAWMVEQGFGLQEDLAHTESFGYISGADVSAVSFLAKERGKNQLGTVGSGNHFLEVGTISSIMETDIAKAWGLEEGQIYILIHCGSRGFGHQICQDTLDTFVKKGFDKNLPDKQLVAAPLQSPEGKRYFQAMATAANFAFCNRQHILHNVRNAFREVCDLPPEEVRLLYDVCHNIAKMEEHVVEGERRTLCIHRKGATRAFGPGEKELPPLYQKTGQPVLVPGDMGRGSYLLAGLGNPTTFSSCCHGAGRKRSRVQSRKAYHGKDLLEEMRGYKVDVMATSNRTISEEMPDAYKSVDLVVDAVQTAGLAKTVAKLHPSMVIKG